MREHYFMSDLGILIRNTFKDGTEDAILNIWSGFCEAPDDDYAKCFKINLEATRPDIYDKYKLLFNK